MPQKTSPGNEFRGLFLKEKHKKEKNEANCKKRR